MSFRMVGTTVNRPGGAGKAYVVLVGGPLPESMRNDFNFHSPYVLFRAPDAMDSRGNLWHRAADCKDKQP